MSGSTAPKIYEHHLKRDTKRLTFDQQRPSPSPKLERWLERNGKLVYYHELDCGDSLTDIDTVFQVRGATILVKYDLDKECHYTKTPVSYSVSVYADKQKAVEQLTRTLLGLDKMLSTCAKEDVIAS